MNRETRLRYAFHEDHEFVKDYLLRIARVVLGRKDQTPHSILHGAYFLRAVQHLPFIISDNEMVRLEWQQTIQKTRASMCVSFNSDEITMDLDEAFFGPYGSEYNDGRVWTATVSGKSGYSDDDLRFYLEELLQNVEKGTEVYFGGEESVPQDDMARDPDPVDWESAFEGVRGRKRCAQHFVSWLLDPDSLLTREHRQNVFLKLSEAEESFDKAEKYMGEVLPRFMKDAPAPEKSDNENYSTFLMPRPPRRDIYGSEDQNRLKTWLEMVLEYLAIDPEESFENLEISPPKKVIALADLIWRRVMELHPQG